MSDQPAISNFAPGVGCWRLYATGGRLDGRLLEPVALPNVASEPPMPGADFDTLQRATLWTAISPFLADQADTSPTFHTPIAAPRFIAVGR